MSHDAAHSIFHVVAGQKYNVHCAEPTPETALKFKQDHIYNMLQDRCEHDFGQHFATKRREMSRLLPHHARSLLCLYVRIMLAFCIICCNNGYS